jgi:cell division protein FtsQ
MAPKQKEKDQSFFKTIRWGRFILWTVAGLFLMVSTLFAFHTTEEFLIKDDRFRIAEPDDFAGQSPNLILEGVHYASPSQIRHVFAEDFGRSLYLVPLERRRRQLLAMDWVEETSVSKIWPNTVKVRIAERTPVAFVHLPPNSRDGLSQFALIDHDGYILRPRVAAKFTLPVVTGIRESEPLPDRRARIHRVLAALRSIGPLGQQISEIDVADPNNLVLDEHVDDTVVHLILGDENYPERLQTFLTYYQQIKAKRPDVATFDLRVDGFVTAVGGEVHGQ